MTGGGRRETPAATLARRDQDHLRVLVDINPHIPDRNTYSVAVCAD